MPLHTDNQVSDDEENALVDKDNEEWCYTVEYKKATKFKRKPFLCWKRINFIPEEENPEFLATELLRLTRPEVAARMIPRTNTASVKRTDLSKTLKTSLHQADIHPILMYKSAKRDQKQFRDIWSCTGPIHQAYCSDTDVLDSSGYEMMGGILTTNPFVKPGEAYEGMDLAMNDHTLLTVPYYHLTHMCCIINSIVHNCSVMRYIIENMASAQIAKKKKEISNKDFIYELLHLAEYAESVQNEMEGYAIEGGSFAKFMLRDAITRGCMDVVRRFVLSQPFMQGSALWWIIGDPRLTRTMLEKFKQ